MCPKTCKIGLVVPCTLRKRSAQPTCSGLPPQQTRVVLSFRPSGGPCVTRMSTFFVDRLNLGFNLNVSDSDVVSRPSHAGIFFPYAPTRFSPRQVERPVAKFRLPGTSVYGQAARRVAQSGKPLQLDQLVFKVDDVSLIRRMQAPQPPAHRCILVVT